MTIFHIIVHKNATDAERLSAIYHVGEYGSEDDSAAWIFITKVARGATDREIILAGDTSFDSIEEAIEWYQDDAPEVNQMVFGSEPNQEPSHLPARAKPCTHNWVMLKSNWQRCTKCGKEC